MSVQSELDALKAQPWYQQVEQIFSSQPRPIPDALWESVALAESGGDPSSTVVDSNGLPSTGLFGLNAGGVGAGYTVQQLQDPTLNAQLAARKMEAALATVPDSASLSSKLTALERAAWPGNDAGLIAQEDPRRQAILQQVQTTATPQSGSTPVAYDDYGRPIYADPQKTIDAGGLIDLTPLVDEIKSIQKQATNFAGELLAITIALAIAAGGFAIIAGGRA